MTEFLSGTTHDGNRLAPGCVECSVCHVVIWESEKEQHECWCLECRHPKGPVGRPKGLEEDGYAQIWTCPCECHSEAVMVAEDAENE